jgi:hypothetical protein
MGTKRIRKGDDMQKWIIPMMVTLALGCGHTAAQARQEQPAPPAQPEPAQPAPASPRTPAAAQEREAARAQGQRARELAAEARAHAAAEGDAAHAYVRALGRNVKKEKVAWMGVVTSQVSGALRKQIKLTHRGVGLVVERVEPKSPADEAGLQQYDILEKLDDQWLVNSQQFGVLVRMHKAGDEVALSLVREGQQQQVRVKLIEKEMVVTDEDGNSLFGMSTPGAAPEVFSWTPSGTAAFNLSIPKLEALESLSQLDVLGDNANVTISDDEHTLKITKKDGKKPLVATDKDGKELFNGPIDTDEQRAEVPEEIRAKLRKFNTLPGVIKMRVGSRTTTNPSDKDDDDNDRK